MTLSVEIIDQVRQRARYVCEYCGVSETDCGGRITVDHYQPQSQNGTDDLDNLVYCCWRCNLHKAAYWPGEPNDQTLWNPRREPQETHLVLLANGLLHPITAIGEFTLNRLELNRSGLVAHRLRRLDLARQAEARQRRHLELAMLEQLHKAQAALFEEQRTMLERTAELLRLLLEDSDRGF